MKLEKVILFCIILSLGCTYAQNKKTDSLKFASVKCDIIQTNKKMHKRFFASTHPVELRINNETFTYATFQLGKRKNKLHLYLKILANNIYIKEDKNVEIYFKSGEIMTLKNQYPLNHESFFARQLKRKEFKKLRDNDITIIKIYTYKKNYELYVSKAQNQDIKYQLNCLSKYKIKKRNKLTINSEDKKTDNE